MSRRRWSSYDLAVANRSYLQVLLVRTEKIMAAQDDLKAAVANAVAVMERAAAAIQAHPTNSAELDAANAAMADAAGQLSAASSALEGDLPAPVPAA